MEYKSELYEAVTPPSLEGEEENLNTLTNVGVVIALTAIALSVAMILTENFMGTPRAHSDRTLGKSQPVADADAILSKIAVISESKAGSK